MAGHTTTRLSKVILYIRRKLLFTPSKLTLATVYALLTELVGLAGPIGNLAENLFWVLLFMCVFVVAFAFVPFMVGQATCQLLSMLGGPVQVRLRCVRASNTLGNSDMSWLQSARLEPFGNAILGYCVVACCAAAYLEMAAIGSPVSRTLRHMLRFFCIFVKVRICVLLCR